MLDSLTTDELKEELKYAMFLLASSWSIIQDDSIEDYTDSLTYELTNNFFKKHNNLPN